MKKTRKIVTNSGKKGGGERERERGREEREGERGERGREGERERGREGEKREISILLIYFIDLFLFYYDSNFLSI